MKLMKIYKIHLEKKMTEDTKTLKEILTRNCYLTLSMLKKVLNVNVLLKKSEEVLTDCSTLCSPQINQY